ncbi:LysR substrate-binding domain-containing protein [Aliamphritea spongicola]|uniref:LysR substrate-binding domain-containing protein n=1 Tax=Aliamphritea spongicola TaxID=707589 RepID=UPI00196A2E3B|nr:LysR family transcriptional regulator [Aliamphritea spongicola]
MDIHQLKTFVTVAAEGSITRAAECLCLSQPAVSAHIKAMEALLGLTLFTRTAKGMQLTSDGQQLQRKAEQALAAHRAVLEEAGRLRGQVSGRLRLGMGGDGCSDLLGQLLTRLAEQYPDVEVTLTHGHSEEVVEKIRAGELDAGFYNSTSEPDSAFTAIEVARFGIYLAAPPGLVPVAEQTDWAALEQLPWIVCPASGTCCGRAAEALFEQHGIRPARIISIDREQVTRKLVAGGVGVGLLHAATAEPAAANGEVALLAEIEKPVRVLFAYRADRQQMPLLAQVAALVQTLADQ